MCLITKQKLPYIALKNITVYKVLEVKDDEVRTPYQLQTVLPNTTYQEKLSKVLKREKALSGSFFKYFGFHAYCNFDQANTYCITLNKQSRFPNPFKFIVVKCVIPFGSIYYKGLCNEILSNKIKYEMFESMDSNR